MKKIAATLVALSFAAAVAAPVAAEAAQSYSAPRNETYQEFIAEKRPYGSASWWQQMDREGRGGQSRAN
jgi:hypothetical protein